MRSELSKRLQRLDVEYRVLPAREDGFADRNSLFDPQKTWIKWLVVQLAIGQRERQPPPGRYRRWNVNGPTALDMLPTGS